ncbi:RNA-binding transcriptional accessory protein [Chromatiales bacterium (ex Bugula neritina AB1)]|nr:RNA-binding transcriptional accessory protein [Chromatiales bacterium (ex Bugula neritina AB1)]
MNPASIIATELGARSQQVDAAIALLDEGSTVPFIARYRKEATGGLDDIQLRELSTRLTYLRELEDRRGKIIDSVSEQGKLSDELKASFLGATSKTELEDLYLPYKPRRRTKAQIAREAGLQPLADKLLENHQADAVTEAAAYINTEAGIETAELALDGARQILMEEIAEIPDLGGQLREFFWNNASITSTVMKGKEEEGSKFKDYFEYHETISKVPSHRALALLRGQNESILKLGLELPDLNPEQRHPCVVKIAAHLQVPPSAEWLSETIRMCWRVKYHTRLETELKLRMRDNGEQAAIEVFAKNLRDLLLAAPAGSKATLGLDPGLRTGVKVAVTAATGKLLDTATIYPHAPQNKWDESINQLAKLAKKYDVKLVAIGNGTASRETDKLAGELIAKHPELSMQKIIVSEAGASVYSASETASREMPDIDVSLRGAASIARRLQDPLAELVKVDPKAIGVGQYQHDVNQADLARSLDAVVEDCVNAVGVDLNSASAELLTHVSGLSQTLAQNIISYRDEIGRYKTRTELKKVPRLGPKAFEQCAGFLRVMDGSNALDASGVHPEAYAVVKKIASDTNKDVRKLIGDSATLSKLDPTSYTDETFGLPTIIDILSELDKPGRDPRPEFKTATFREGVEKISDLQPDMVLEGVVSNVTHFGAFVDIGVHQDGLVHISMLADKYVKDPHDVVSTGDVVRVKVMEVDPKRKRIALSMKLQETSRDNAANTNSGSSGGASAHTRKPNHQSSGKERPSSANERSAKNKGRTGKQKYQNDNAGNMGSFGAALLDAQKKRK